MNLDFFIIGSQRCGTTWIDAVLRSTGKILLPENKQTYYFDRNYSNGDEWYYQQFNADKTVDYRLIGEVATGYCLDGAVDRLAISYPEAKIILTVREPISRAYSNFIKRGADYTTDSFEEALDTDADLVERGLYGDMLERVFKFYPSNRVKVVYFEDLQKNPRQFISEILEFLELDCPIDKKFFNQNINSSHLEKIVRFTKKYNIYFLIKVLKFAGLTGFVRKIIYMLQRSKKSNDYTVTEAMKKKFTVSNDKLQQYTNRPFTK